MAIKARFFQIKNDYDLDLGSLIQQGNDWCIRAAVDDRGEKAQLTMSLTGEQMGQFNYLHNSSRCVALDPDLKLEIRVDGIVEGPGGPPVGSLVWSVDGASQAICAKDGFFMTMAGVHSKAFSGHRAFFARKWSIWIVGEDGKDIGGGPLVSVDA